MSQSKKGSLLEQFVNIVIGYSFGVVTQILIFPIFDIIVSADQNFKMAGIFTLISLVRGYYVRRLFNKFGWFSDDIEYPNSFTKYELNESRIKWIKRYYKYNRRVRRLFDLKNKQIESLDNRNE